jgi:hypothetical protein
MVMGKTERPYARGVSTRELNDWVVSTEKTKCMIVRLVSQVPGKVSQHKVIP